ncbi:phosphotransferase [Arthrobacter sp. ATA002]|uniref:phosphotransferase n=1 Tax=Arthrobacter sp. ATA002 TaxID=2991715 RepID=UPI0022A77F3F|nr:phosphotransferase [Arthrobacter sp. ATA002]WAP50434.1 phosphotransferase [Arthrobacter sp. ATA002]
MFSPLPAVPVPPQPATAGAPCAPGVPSPPLVPDYRVTAVRRTWAGLPDLLRRRAAAHLGGTVSAVRSAGGGFTPGFAAVLEGAGSERIFAKAAPETDSFIYPSYLREAEVARRMPAGMPVPVLSAAEQLTVDGTGWQLLVYEAVDGAMPGHPWTDRELQAIEASCAEAVRILKGFPRELAGEPLAGDLTAVPSGFLSVADGAPAPWFLPGLTARHAAGFQELLALCPEALAGEAVLHGDLRPDNILIRSGRALICDWNFLGTGAEWTDWVSVLPYAHSGGLDADAWLQRSALTRGVPARHIDAFLAALLNYMIHSGSQPDVPSSPQLRAHGRHTARIVYDWCLRRNAV